MNSKDNILILSQDIELMIKYNIKKLISCVDCIEINVNNKMVSLKIPFEINNKTYNIVKYVSIWHTNNITLEVKNLLKSADEMITNIKLGGEPQ